MSDRFDASRRKLRHAARSLIEVLEADEGALGFLEALVDAKHDLDLAYLAIHDDTRTPVTRRPGLRVLFNE